MSLFIVDGVSPAWGLAGTCCGWRRRATEGWPSTTSSLERMGPVAANYGFAGFPTGRHPNNAAWIMKTGEKFAELWSK